MHRPILLLAALLAAFLAGCTDGGDDGDGGAELLDAMEPQDEHGDEDVAGGPDVMEAAVERALTFTSNALAGIAPANITFAIDGTDLANATAWGLDAGDGTILEGPASDLPLEFAYVYEEAGNWAAVASLTYNDGAVLEEMVDLTVEPGAPPAGTYVRDELLESTGTILLGIQGDSCGMTGTFDVANIEWTINATETDGTAVQLGRLDVLLTLDSLTNLDTDLFVYGPSGDQIGSSTAFNAAESAQEEVNLDGPLPPGTYRFELLGCLGVEMDYTLTARAPIVTV